MGGFRLEGNTSGNVAEVTAANELKVTLTQQVSAMGQVSNWSQMDPGTLSGNGPLYRNADITRFGKTKVGLTTSLFNDQFNASIQNTNNWYYSFTTMTAAQPGAGTINFGAVQGTASAHYAMMRTFQYFTMKNSESLEIEFTCGMFTAALVANEIWAMGIGLPSTNSLPTDGVYFQLTSAGLIGCLAYNSTVTQTGTLVTIGNTVLGQIDRYRIVVGYDACEFWKNGYILATLPIPTANNQPMQQPALPLFMMKTCTGVVSSTNTMRVGNVLAQIPGQNCNLPYPSQLALMGQNAQCAQNGTTNASTQFIGTITTGSSPQQPTAAAPSNTAAGAVGLGGTFAYTTIAGGATDYIGTSYQNPSPTINISGKNLLVYGVRISTINLGAAVATSPTTLLWTLAYGHTAVSLQTVETATFATATTHAPRRVQLGYQSAAIGTVIGGTYSPDIVQSFTVPFVIRPGEFVATMVKVVIGTATASQVINCNVMFDAVFE